MRAARLYAAKDVRIEDVPTPQPCAGEVLVKVQAVAICPSDWRMWDAADAGGAPLTEPIIQGHEFAGEIVALGEGVTDISLGTRVAVEPSWHCGHCDMCQRGLFNVCRNIRFPSFPPVNGALAEFIACPQIAVHAIPDNMSFAEGTLIEPLGVSLHAMRLAFGENCCQSAPNQSVSSVIIFGAGIIGICAVQLAKLAGAPEVVVVEPIAKRREYTMQFGANRTYESCEELLAAKEEAEVVFECSGYSGAVAEALHAVTPGGHLMVVGIPHPETVTFEANVPRRHELTLTFTRRSRKTLAEATDLVAAGSIDLKSLPIREFSLAETSKAIALTGDRPGDMLRAIVYPDR